MPQSSKLQTGAIAGIVVGAVVVIAALLALLWWLRKRRQRRQQQGQAVAEPRTSSPRGHELDSWYKLRDHKPSEADSRQLLSEEYNVKYKHELPGRYEHELPGKEQQDRQEMDTGPVSPELEGDGQAYELAGDTIHPFHRDSRNSPGISPSSSTRKYQSLNSPP